MINKFNILQIYKVAKTQAIVLFFNLFRYKTTKILAQIEQNSPMFQQNVTTFLFTEQCYRLRHVTFIKSSGTSLTCKHRTH